MHRNGRKAKLVDVRVVDSHDDLVWALMIRSAVFVGEDGCLLSDEADGNDLGATHLLARVGGQPAGTMRIRYFGHFAVLERMAVLRPHRGRRYGCRGVAWELGAFAFEFCRMKGYTRFYGQARDGLVEFWRRFAPEGAAFEPIPGASIVAKGILCHPMAGAAPPLPIRVGGMEDHELLKERESRLPSALSMRAGPAAAGPSPHARAHRR